MCLSRKLVVKSRNDYAPKQYRVSCGNCEECRAVYKESWNFRLQAELEALMSQGWKAGFITLTYSDVMLPVITPSKLIDKDSDEPLYRVWPSVRHEDRFSFGVPRIPCFDRSQVHDYFVSLRQWLYREYSLSKEFRLRYIACCEYGSHTKRPHMHCMVIFPPCVDSRRFFQFMCESWEWYGFTIPSKDHFEGWVDRKGKEHKGFLIDSYAKASRYCAKYTTKDIYYVEAIDKLLSKYRLRFAEDRRYLRSSLAFHCQSKSLGVSILDRFKTDADKLSALRDGVFFVGEDKPRVLPVYIKNKILYDNRYVYEMISPNEATISVSKGRKVPELGCIAFGEDFPCRRVVERQASDFFKRNIVEIFNLKVKKYSEFFAQLIDGGCMHTRRLALCGRAGVSVRTFDFMGKPWDDLRNYMAKVDLSCDDLAKLYLVYYGKKKPELVLSSAFPYAYLQRYTSDKIDLPTYLDDDCLTTLDTLWGFLDNCFRWWTFIPKVRSYDERLADCVSDMFKSQE